MRVLVVQTFAVSWVIPISTRKQQKNLFDLRVKLPLVTTILTTKGKGNLATYLQLKEKTSELVCFYTTTTSRDTVITNFLRLLG